MKDIIEQDFMIGFEGRRECPNCEDVFKPRRPNMKFCCANCRKAHSRGIRNSQNSKATARENMEFFDTAIRMGNRYYDLPPYERDGYMSELIADARAGNTQLRKILSNWKLLHPNPVDERWMLPRGSWAYGTIAQEAQQYCWKYWGKDVNVRDVVYARIPEPPTGEVENDT